MTIASVRAPLPAPPGWAWMQTEPPIERIVAQVDAGADALAEWALRAAGGDPVVLLGFSQGGATTVDAVRRWPGAFAAAVSLAGFLVGSDRAGAAAAPPTPLFVGHGTADDVVPLSWNEMLLEWAREHTELEQHRYPGLAHAVSEDQLRDVSAFLSTVL
jgi:phospholipase/carboxylesterase